MCAARALLKATRLSCYPLFKVHLEVLDEASQYTFYSLIVLTAPEVTKGRFCIFRHSVRSV